MDVDVHQAGGGGQAAGIQDLGVRGGEIPAQPEDLAVLDEKVKAIVYALGGVHHPPASDQKLQGHIPPIAQLPILYRIRAENATGRWKNPG